MPGDHISYINKILYINGKAAKQKFIRYASDSNSLKGPSWTVKVMQENLFGIKHNIYLCLNNNSHCPIAVVQNYHDVIRAPRRVFYDGR